jgi:hypothetical protein
LCIYEVVVCGDTDELIVIDPAVRVSFREYVLDLPQDAAVAPLGFDLVPPVEYFDRPDRVTVDVPLLRQVNRAVFMFDFCKPSIFKRPVRLSTGQHGLLDGKFSVDPNLALFHLKFLAINQASDYDLLAEEVRSEWQAKGRIRSKTWGEGFAGLREYAMTLGHPNKELPVLEPRAASVGYYSMDQSKLKPYQRVGGNPFRVAAVGDPPMFSLPEHWLDMI